ncbi:unnamed protein product [Haemonchus placei]|uniref:t-SNARE coiled-coil homology domain-containing protein n=1 Tax=Haemonchus placei TaxID=6290 RepID=A0A0N4X0G2_HAEPC|nr:unnamed protein product [Haemonchus placei]
MHSQRRKVDDLQKIKQRLRSLQAALLTLKKPADLFNSIVNVTREVMLLCSTHSHFRSQAHRNASSSEKWRERKRDVEILGAETENCELPFFSPRQHLRVLHASTPILIALGKLSNAAWNTMLDQPLHYEDAKGNTQPVLIRMETVEDIVVDQLASIKDFYAELRILQTTIIQNELQERKLDEQIVLASLNAVKNSVNELAKRMDSYPMRPFLRANDSSTDAQHNRAPEETRSCQARSGRKNKNKTSGTRL